MQNSKRRTELKYIAYYKISIDLIDNISLWQKKIPVENLLSLK